MIFVTVGTHEQPFNRLVKAIDDLKLNGKLKESVFIQTGYSTYEPKACQHKDFISMDQMNDYMKSARVIITHGGPSSFILALQHNKIPLVVPRLTKFHEHVNNHQLIFCRELINRDFPIRMIENLDNLLKAINEMNSLDYSNDIILNNAKFVSAFKLIVEGLI